MSVQALTVDKNFRKLQTLSVHYWNVIMRMGRLNNEGKGERIILVGQAENVMSTEMITSLLSRFFKPGFRVLNGNL